MYSSTIDNLPVPELVLSDTGQVGQPKRHSSLQVTTEGGYDAAMEAPYIYAAIDALAVRAGKWAERRQRLLLEALPEDSGLPSPESAAAAAIAAVKEVACVIPTGLQGLAH